MNETILDYLVRLYDNYNEVFMEMYHPGCKECGEPRLVHKSPVCLKLGEDLKKIINAHIEELK